MESFFVYILASNNKNVLYTGVTNDLNRRMHEHKNTLHSDSFTSRYKIKKLVYFEIYPDINNAIQREKRIKKWDRAWKNDLINKHNLEWKDLAQHLNDSLV